MSPETIVVVNVGIARAGLIVNSWRDLRSDLQKPTTRAGDLSERVKNPSERLSRIEGLIEGVIGSRNSGSRSQAFARFTS